MKRIMKPKSKVSVSSTGPSTTNRQSPAGGDSSTPLAKAFYDSLEDPTMVELVRTNIKTAHVFKLPPRQTAVGWRGADWRDSDKIWVGSVKVVDRGDITAIVLVDPSAPNGIFAVCPYQEGAVDRCVDSSRYFVLRVESKDGKRLFVGLAFNDRNHAFDFNTGLQDSKKEREAPVQTSVADGGPTKDYSLKEGQKIRVNISKLNLGNNDDNEDGHPGSDEATKKKSLGIKKILGSNNSASNPSKIVKVKKPPKRTTGGSFLAPPTNDTRVSRRNQTSPTIDRTTDAIDMFAGNDDLGFDTSDIAFSAFPTTAL